MSGNHSRTRLSGFYGALQEMQHKQETVVESDHPAVLVGEDHAPTAVEYLLHGIAGCLTAGIANIAAARGVNRTADNPVTIDILANVCLPVTVQEVLTWKELAAGLGG